MAPLKIPKPGLKTLSTAANLSNLLPTGTVLAFQALMPSFTNNGSCITSHKVLTSSATITFSLVCFISSFTDSFIAGGKLYYGIATPKGLHIFNRNKNDDADDVVNDNNKVPNEREGDNRVQRIEDGVINRVYDEKEILAMYRLQFKDFVHGFCSWLVFMVYAMCSSDVLRCFYPHPSDNVNILMMNLPLAIGGAVSFLFTLFPTRRRGIGYADKEAHKK
ncbi:hypothetical protein LWI28_020737 [Acer negundo]|uniref:Uncharacterized protein n=1 Tax=Acer negundo TaxID=4023 RepID=A0AAD5J7F6_ACENE|nr:hypothetical protein LWI28_020737 [Acer negundo]KAK4851879.1 hypothetical protein QYF36_019126 [Acer negundo]